jgi:hypothetical protein
MSFNQKQEKTGNLVYELISFDVCTLGGVMSKAKKNIDLACENRWS